jgi:hypothetical protein
MDKLSGHASIETLVENVTCSLAGFLAGRFNRQAIVAEASMRR